ncbi:MAG: hypothetical protein HS104_16900 [Polyangiaceae bacterium]|nr:hypothetical protein [Polyangiaceae bacterium]
MPHPRRPRRFSEAAVLAIGVLTTQCVESLPAASPDTYSAICDGDGECARFCASVEHRKREKCESDQQCEARAQDSVKAQCIEGWNSSRPRTAAAKSEPLVDESFAGCVKREKRDCKHTCKVSETGDIKGCTSSCESSVPLMCAHRLVKECGTAEDRDTCESRIKADVKLADPSLAQQIWPEPAPPTPKEPACPDLPRSTDPQLEAKITETGAAAAADWRATKRTDLPGDMGAIVEYEPTETNKGPEGLGLPIHYARTDIMTRDRVITLLGTQEQEWRACRPVLSLTGGEPDTLVFQDIICGANCSGRRDDDIVLRFSNGRWSRPKAVPKRPYTHQDWDGDGVPEFTYPILSMKAYDCSDTMCRSLAANIVEVRGIEQWDGVRFTANLSALLPWYKREAERARAQATNNEGETQAKEPDDCPANALSLAAARYIYGVVDGEAKADAMAAADRFARRLDTSACTIDWSALRSRAMAAKLPRFGASTSKMKPLR